MRLFTAHKEFQAIDKRVYAGFALRHTGGLSWLQLSR